MVLKPFTPPQDEQAQKRIVYAARWGARAETAAAIARRLQETLTAVAALGGPYSPPWTLATDHGKVTLPHDEDAWVDLVVSGYETDANDNPYLPGGSSLLFTTAKGEPNGLRVKLSVTVGRSEPARGRSANHVIVSATSTLATDFSPVAAAATPAAARKLVEDLVTIWAPDSASATTDAAIEPQFRREWRGMPTVGAITWLSGRVWPLPAEIPSVEVEAFGEGTLLTVGSVQEPSFRTDDLTAVAEFLAERGLRGPAPAVQDPEPRVSLFRADGS